MTRSKFRAESSRNVEAYSQSWGCWRSVVLPLGRGNQGKHQTLDASKTNRMKRSIILAVSQLGYFNNDFHYFSTKLYIRWHSSNEGSLHTFYSRKKGKNILDLSITPPPSLICSSVGNQYPAICQHQESSMGYSDDKPGRYMYAIEVSPNRISERFTFAITFFLHCLVSNLATPTSNGVYVPA